MARTVATPPAGKTQSASVRQRDLPAHVAVYYVIARAFCMRSSYREVLRRLLEGIQWLRDPPVNRKAAGKSGISQARTRRGWEPLEHLHDELVRPIAVRTTQDAWRWQWRLFSLDGSTLDVAGEKANEDALGRPGASRGNSACPQIRFVALVENVAHVLFLEASWTPTARAGSRWPSGFCRACAKRCFAWPTGSSSASSSGGRLWRRARICCGG